MIYSKSIICHLDKEIDPDNQRRPHHGATWEKVEETLTKARTNRVILRSGAVLPQHLYEYGFFRSLHTLSQEMVKKIHELDDPLTLTPALKANPIANNVAIPDGVSQEDFYAQYKVEGVESIAETINLKELKIGYFSFWQEQEAVFTKCASLLEFIVLINFTIQNAKATNHLIVMGVFFYKDMKDTTFLCFIEENVVKISEFITPENEKLVYLTDFLATSVQSNIIVQLKNVELEKDIQSKRGVPWAEFVRVVFEDNKESIANAVASAFVQPLVKGINDEVVEPLVKRLKAEYSPKSFSS